jgi:hypothetical protein
MPQSVINNTSPDYNIDIATNSAKSGNVALDLPKGVDKSTGLLSKSKPSIFNRYHVVAGRPDNILLDTDIAANSDFLNPSINNLINKGTGANVFDYSDFFYTTKYGEISNNRLITLRRFPYPVFDDIFTPAQAEPDIARMVTWSTQEANSLKELFKFSFGLNWKELTAVMEQASMLGEQEGVNGFMKHISRAMSPQYGSSVMAGEFQNQYDPTHDSNKVYGPVDSITQTHIRDVGLNFEQTFSVEFHYEAKSLNGVNPKAAFIDLLSNVLATTMNNGKFWGGARYWVGIQPSDFRNSMHNAPRSEFNKMMSVSHSDFQSTIGGWGKKIGEMMNSDNATAILKNLSNIGMGKVIDKAGRPSIAVMNSLLSNEPVGEWHVTVGNPLRPMLSIGNLILTNTTIEVDDDTLGYDDFPIRFKVTCELKHAMPRDKAGIENMLNAGQGRTYWKPADDELAELRNKQHSSNTLFTNQVIDVAAKSIFDFIKK